MGILMLGKISVGVDRISTGLRMRMTNANTIKGIGAVQCNFDNPHRVCSTRRILSVLSLRVCLQAALLLLGNTFAVFGNARIKPARSG
jgi:hypothetical protein